MRHEIQPGEDIQATIQNPFAGLGRPPTLLEAACWDAEQLGALLERHRVDCEWRGNELTVEEAWGRMYCLRACFGHPVEEAERAGRAHVYPDLVDV